MTISIDTVMLFCIFALVTTPTLSLRAARSPVSAMLFPGLVSRDPTNYHSFTIRLILLLRRS